MLDLLPLWLQIPIAFGIAGGVFYLWIRSLSDLWKQEQTDKVRRAAQHTASAPPDGGRSTRDVLYLLAAATALVALGYASNIGTAAVRQLAMTGIILAVAVQQWRSRRRAKQDVEHAQHGEYQPFQDVR